MGCDMAIAAFLFGVSKVTVLHVSFDGGCLADAETGQHSIVSWSAKRGMSFCRA